MGKIPWRKPAIAIRKPSVDGRLAFDFVRDVRIADGDIDIVVAMAMHKRRRMRRDFNLENAKIFVVEGEMVRRFSGDLDFGGCLGEQERDQEEEEQCALHGVGL